MTPTSTPTRERLVTEATRLFSGQGFQATSVSQIEAAAGLAAGSGALYHHFKSKDALLDAVVGRQLDRRKAMRDIRGIFAGLGDLHAELTALGRYLHTILEQEALLLQTAARTPTGRSTRLDTAYTALIGSLTDELTDWITAWAPSQTRQQCELLASAGLNAILGAHLAASLFHQPPALQTGDYLTEWTALLATRIEALNTGD